MGSSRRLIDLGLRLAVLTAAFLIPLVFYLDAYEVFELAKSMALKIFGMGAVLLLLLRREPVRARSIPVALLFLGMCLLSMMRTPLPVASLERIWELACFVTLLWAFESCAIPKGALLSMMFASWSLVTFYGLLQYCGVDWIQWTSFGEKRVYATMGNPDFLAAQSSFLIPIMGSLLFATWGRRTLASALIVLCLLLALPSMLYAQARGALIGFVTGLYAVIWLADRYILRHSLGQTIRRMAILTAVLATILYAAPPGRHLVDRFIQIARDPVRAADLQIRLFYWYSGFLMGRSAPLTGSGIGAFHLSGAGAQATAQDIWNRVWPRAAESVSPHLELYAHNDYVHLFAEIGPIGLGLYLWAMVALLIAGLSAVGRMPPERQFDRWLGIGLLSAAFSFYVNSLMNFPLKVVPNAHLMFCCVAAILLPLTALKPRLLPLPKSPVVAACVLLAVLWLSERAGAKLVATSYLKFGHRILLANQPREALSLLDRARRLRPVHTDAILINYYSGKAKQGLEDYQGAADDYSKAIAVFPDFPEGHQARGLAGMAIASKVQPKDEALATKIMDLAVKDLESSAWLNSKEPVTWFYLGSARRIQRRPADSVEPFLKCIRYDPEMRIPDARFGLAQSLADLRRPAEARKWLEELLARNPTFPGGRALLSKLSRK